MENLASHEQNIAVNSKLLQMIHGYRVTQLIYVAAKLGISDLLKDGEKGIAYLANKTNTNEYHLYRILRALSSIGIFEENNKTFKSTPLSSALESDAPHSIRSVAIMRGEESNWKPWGEILHSVKTGENVFEEIFNMGLFEYYSKNHEQGILFNQSMNILSKQVVPHIVNSYNFSSFKSIVEIGGGYGTLLCAILEKYKDLNGVLFDLPHVIKEATEKICNADIKNRCSLVEGNFFDFVPRDADAYILKLILHDWNDDLSIKILKNCNTAMEKGKKILLVEQVINPEKNYSASTINDIHMMLVTTGGKERTREEFNYILHESGFKLTNIYDTGSAFCIIEGTKL